MHSKQDPDVPDAVVKIPRTDYRIPCRDCDKVLPNKTALYKHRKNEHSDMSLLMEESEEAQQDGATCLHCNITFSHIGELQKHLKSTTVRNHRMVNTGVRAWPCGRCSKRFRIKSDLRTHLRLKHPSHLVVVEIQSSNPSALDVMNVLSQNNIPHDRVLEINKMTFAKGVTSVIPSSVRALTMLNDVPKIPVAYGKPQVESSTGEWQTFRRCRAMATCSPRIGQIFQITPEQHQENGGSYSVNMDVNNEVLSTHQEISAQDFSTRPQLAAHQLFAVHHDLTLQPELAGQQILAERQELTVQQELAVNQEIPVRQELPVGQEILMRQEIPTHQELATNQELSDLNTHMLLHDRAVTNGNQMVQIQFDDTILLQ